MPGLRRSNIAALACALLVSATEAHALDKQGSAHGGDVGQSPDGVQVSGSASLGLALYNPTYAARPDNSGKALARYALHIDIDLIGAKLSIPIDLNTFTDRERSGARKLLPTELDLIGGLSTTWQLNKALAMEGGARVESDRAIDRAGDSQTYVDLRSRLLFSVVALAPQVDRWLGGGDVSGWLTLGVFAYNPTYYARPDNTGLALMRYAPHLEVSFWRERLSLGIDATMFTDRQGQVFRPSELDLTPDVALHLGEIEVHLAYERDMPLDRGGLVQHWVYTTLVYGFRVTGAEAPR
jgi:hypothetical protein